MLYRQFSMLIGVEKKKVCYSILIYYYCYYQFSTDCFFLCWVTFFIFICANIRRHRISKTSSFNLLKNSQPTVLHQRQTYKPGNLCALDFSEQAHQSTDAEHFLEQRLCLSGRMCSSHTGAHSLKGNILSNMILLTFARLGLCFHLAAMQNFSALSFQGTVLCGSDVLTKQCFWEHFSTQTSLPTWTFTLRR